jgi:N4-(beta-N-acetylglucosaminyl)-L-asparaginase
MVSGSFQSFKQSKNLMPRRRKFLKQLIGLGVSLPLISNHLSASTNNRGKKVKIRGPIILCSRGRTWGEKVLQPGWRKYHETKSILDAVEAGANVVELDPEDRSVGYGGLPNENGIVTLDSSIMFGPTHNCGSVASLKRIKKASSVARLVMERTDHMMLVGEGAFQFARAHGFPEENLLTERSRKIWLRWKENISDRDDWLPPEDGDYGLENRPGGTINVLGLDENGNLSGITTTSGLFGKIDGRVGDSPIIGAGLYVDNSVGAAGATGRGEEVIRTCGSFLVIEMMRQGKSPQEACELACQRIIDINGGLDKVDFNDKFVAISKEGEVGCAAIMGSEKHPPRAAYISGEGFQVLDGTYFKTY